MIYENLNRARISNRFLLIGVLLMSCSPVLAKRLPNEIELRAAYCIPVVADSLQLAKRLDWPGRDVESKRLLVETLNAIEADRQRLISYLDPRLQYLDIPSLTAASKRGEADVARWNQDRQNCFDVCQVEKSPELDESKMVCAKKCAEESEARKRLGRCNDLSFLPF